MLVCGVHEVAQRTVEQLRVAGAVHVVDPVDERAERMLTELAVPLVVGRANAGLLAAGPAGAAAVVCMADDDYLVGPYQMLLQVPRRRQFMIRRGRGPGAQEPEASGTEMP